jgi:hypothetical protein
MMFLILLVEELEGCLDFEISGRSRANALGGLIISQSGVKRIAVTAVTWYRGIRETFFF